MLNVLNLFFNVYSELGGKSRQNLLELMDLLVLFTCLLGNV